MSIEIFPPDQPRTLRARITKPNYDYGVGEEPFGFELEKPELSPKIERVRGEKFISALTYVQKDQLAATDSQLMTADSPSRILTAVGTSLASTKGLEPRRKLKIPLTRVTSTSMSVTRGYTETKTVLYPALPKLPTSKPDEPSTPKSLAYSSPCSLALTTSTPETPLVKRIIIASPSHDSEPFSGRASPQTPSEASSDDGEISESSENEKPKSTSGETTKHETSSKSHSEPGLTSKPETTPTSSKPKHVVATQTSDSGLDLIASPVLSRLNRTLDSGTPLSRVWTSKQECLTYPSQDLTLDVSTDRYRAIEAVAKLKDEDPLTEYKDLPHEGDDIILDSMEQYPIYVQNTRIVDKVDETLGCYKQSSYAPSFRSSVQANIAGCSHYGTNLKPKLPVRSKSGSFPNDLNSMNLIQSEAVRLETNNRTLVRMAENDAHLMPALINFVNQYVEDDDSPAVRQLNSVVNGLRTNMSMREKLIAENLAITTAVRRRDNIERICTNQTAIDHFVSRGLNDESTLIPMADS